ncbi:MAG: hypothetical protein Q7T86_16120 [Hyphomicrobiaceae bacterium]|nr:hypothetical protein [Hyphomicrobiaceae bacterium]
MANFSVLLTRNPKSCLLAFAAIIYFLPFALGLWAAQLIANVYGLISAFLLAIPFFFNDWIKKSRQQATTAEVRGSGEILRAGQLKRLDRLATSWTPAHLRMMQFGLTFLAVSYLLVITTMIAAACTAPAAP